MFLVLCQEITGLSGSAASVIRSWSLSTIVRVVQVSNPALSRHAVDGASSSSMYFREIMIKRFCFFLPFHNVSCCHFVKMLLVLLPCSLSGIL